jgi:hypothetical protein
MPVLLTAGLAGAAGYGAYRGGEKAVHVGKRKVEDVKRNNRRREEQRELTIKARDRSTRLNDIQQRIQNARSGSTATSASVVEANTNNNNTATTTTSTTTTTTTTANTNSHDDRLQKERLQGLKERYSEARGKTNNQKKGFLRGGVFAKKKSSNGEKK